MIYRIKSILDAVWKRNPNGACVPVTCEREDIVGILTGLERGVTLGKDDSIISWKEGDMKFLVVSVTLEMSD